MEDGRANLDKKKLINEKSIQKIFEYIEEIHYGSIVLIIQDGCIIQIEKNEKIRIK